MSCLLFKTQLKSLGFPLSHRKHITYPLRSQQINVTYRCVTMVYGISITILDIDIGLSFI
jgi:hypothetical protein